MKKTKIKIKLPRPPGCYLGLLTRQLEKPPLKYQLVQCQNGGEEMQQAVNAQIQAGWKCLAGVSVAVESSGYIRSYTQAMVKE